MKKILLILSMLLFVSGLNLQKFKLEETGFQSLKDWDKDNHAEALETFKKSCKKKNFSSNYLIKEKAFEKYRDNWEKVCSLALVNQRGAKEFFEENFVPYKVSYGELYEGKFTGYYKISLKGSFTKTEKYKYPIYKKPEDLKEGVEYYTREEIGEGALDGKNLELLWVEDRVKLYFLHIQGSGLVYLENGDTVNILFAGKNNNPYTSISKVVMGKKYMKTEDINASSLQKWLRDNPDKQDEILYSNKSYIFFKISEEKETIGSEGVGLTANRSLAVDNSFIPYGLPLWLETYTKDSAEAEKQEYNHLMTGQDTGSAIRGSVRGDIFFGIGDEAESRANFQNFKGRYYILLPR